MREEIPAEATVKEVPEPFNPIPICRADTRRIGIEYHLVRIMKHDDCPLCNEQPKVIEEIYRDVDDFTQTKYDGKTTYRLRCCCSDGTECFFTLAIADEAWNKRNNFLKRYPDLVELPSHARQDLRDGVAMHRLRYIVYRKTAIELAEGSVGKSSEASILVSYPSIWEVAGTLYPPGSGSSYGRKYLIRVTSYLFSNQGRSMSCHGETIEEAADALTAYFETGDLSDRIV